MVMCGQRIIGDSGCKKNFEKTCACFCKTRTGDQELGSKVPEGAGSGGLVSVSVCLCQRCSLS